MVNIIFYIFVFIFGLTVGSFLNCVIYRLEKKESALKGRSYCPHCKHQLAWYDLIPVLSFIILKGKCRYCYKKISLQYPLVEIATASLFTFIFWHLSFGFDLEQFGTIWILDFLALFAITSFLIVIFVYDLKHYIIPDKVIFPAIAIVFLYKLFEILNLEFVSDFGFRISDFKPLLYSLGIAFAASAFFLTIVLVTRGKGMGIGDIKLAFLMGLLLGWPNIFVALFLAFLIGAIIGIGLILARKKTLKSEVPFGPFLVTGTFIAMFYGNQIIGWYLNLF
ncbi:prepilin peptidase [Candidatus Parcubacteria bacterium]|nr:prepilin peptidase [Candidatus Parcubacteria bacterium]